MKTTVSMSVLVGVLANSAQGFFYQPSMFFQQAFGFNPAFYNRGGAAGGQTYNYNYNNRGYQQPAQYNLYGAYAPSYNHLSGQTVKVQLCFDALQVHSSDADNVADFHEEWQMRMGLIAQGGQLIQTAEIKVPVMMSGAGFMSPVGQCQVYPMTAQEMQQLVVYTDGMERDTPPFNPDDVLPSSQTAVNFNGAFQRFALRAADKKHSYTAYGSVRLAY
jgi:hypothetical protein